MADDLGDGLRARIEELEQRISVALGFTVPPETPEYRDGYADALDDVRFALRGDL